MTWPGSHCDFWRNWNTAVLITYELLSLPPAEAKITWAYLESSPGAVHTSAAAFLVDFLACEQSASEQVTWVKADEKRWQSRGLWLRKGGAPGSVTLGAQPPTPQAVESLARCGLGRSQGLSPFPVGRVVLARCPACSLLCCGTRMGCASCHRSSVCKSLLSGMLFAGRDAEGW